MSDRLNFRMRRRRYRIAHRGSSNNADAALDSVPLLRQDNQANIDFMGHSKGRDNAKKRAKRRKKTERLALGKKTKPATRATP